MEQDKMSVEPMPDAFALVENLQLTASRPGERTGGLLEDTASGRFFRLGPAEFAFVRALIATSSAPAAFAACETLPEEQRLSPGAAGSLCKWLASNNLIQGASAPASTGPTKSLLSAAFFWKLPLGNPDQALKTLVRYFGWLFSGYAFVACGLVFLLAVAAMTGNWGEFLSCYENLFSAQRAPAVLIAWCLLKAIHELAHAGVCRRYGGEVREAGVAFILLVPLAYVNVTSSWRFGSQWKRLHVTLAGIAAEAAVAAAALAVWSVSGSLTIQQIAADVFLTATVSTFLFNMNPLLRFDGYFAVADLTNVDNLYSLGQRYARYFGGRYLLGLNVSLPTLPGTRTAWIKLYGLAAAIYRTLTVVGLILGAAAMFEGAGIVIAAGGLFSFAVHPLVKLLQHLRTSYNSGQLSVTRLALRLGCIAGFSIGMISLIPVGVSRTVPAVVQYDPPCVLRATSAGFVDQILAHDGEWVVAGQTVVVLRNDALVQKRDRSRTELAQTEKELLKARWLGESSEAKQLQSSVEAIKKQLVELDQDVEQLAIVATRDGRVVARRLPQLLGSYLEAGTEIGVVGLEDQKRLKVSLSQRDVTQLQAADRPVKVRVIDDKQIWDATVERIEARASTQPADPALLALNGGRLASRVMDSQEPELSEARVNAIVSIAPAHSSNLLSGQRAFVALGVPPKSILQALTTHLREFLAW
ncbi:MAG TPA: hypothetical protein DDW52_18825 [Planctomycetaceae bacterium]|nr:hypothetical protein [Planctomycetaceae bacterium]